MNSHNEVTKVIASERVNTEDVERGKFGFVHVTFEKMAR